MQKNYWNFSKLVHMNYQKISACYNVISEIISDLTYYYSEQLKHEISLMMNAQLKKLIP